jgi:hypothetical protein
MKRFAEEIYSNGDDNPSKDYPKIGIMPWRNSWCHYAVAEPENPNDDVYVEVFGHYCGSEFRRSNFLRYIFTSLKAKSLSWAENQFFDFKEYKIEGDELFLKIVDLIDKEASNEDEKVEQGKLLEQFVLERNALREKIKKESGEHLPYLDELLIENELKALQEKFGDYEGILEQRTAKEILASRGDLERKLAILKRFPYYERYDNLTDIELRNTVDKLLKDRAEKIKLCFIGGGQLPISAIMYALKRRPNIQITVIEKDEKRAKIAQKVIHSLGLDNEITIINEYATNPNVRPYYYNQDIFIFAAMVESKESVFKLISNHSSKHPSTIVLRAPLEDSKVIYQGLLYYRDKEIIKKAADPYYYYFDHSLRIDPENQGKPTDASKIFGLHYFDSVDEDLRIAKLKERDALMDRTKHKGRS